MCQMVVSVSCDLIGAGAVWSLGCQADVGLMVRWPVGDVSAVMGWRVGVGVSLVRACCSRVHSAALFMLIVIVVFTAGALSARGYCGLVSAFELGVVHGGRSSLLRVQLPGQEVVDQRR